MAGSMTLDKEWDLLKDPLPRSLSAKTAKEMERCDLLVRAQQFRRMVSTGDTWAALLEGAQHWMGKQTAPSAPQGVALGKMGAKLSEALRARRRPASADAGAEAVACAAGAGKQGQGADAVESELRELVPSLAGGLAERCGHTTDHGSRCECEVHACCPECLVALCARHMFAEFPSRCHEHSVFGVDACPCLECQARRLEDFGLIPVV